jgi:hypothetical protein
MRRGPDIDVYGPPFRERRQEVTSLRMERHASEIEELHVEGILAFAERILPRAANLWVQSSLDQRSGSNSCSSLKESRSMATNLFVRAAATHRPSATCGRPR